MLHINTLGYSSTYYVERLYFTYYTVIRHELIFSITSKFSEIKIWRSKLTCRFQRKLFAQISGKLCTCCLGTCLRSLKFIEAKTDVSQTDRKGISIKLMSLRAFSLSERDDSRYWHSISDIYLILKSIKIKGLAWGYTNKKC